jgi:hypothetical protein
MDDIMEIGILNGAKMNITLEIASQEEQVLLDGGLVYLISWQQDLH